MQNEVVNFDRVCNLQKGDRFLLNGIWREVYAITDTEMKHRARSLDGLRTYGHKSLNKNSQQIFQVVKAPPKQPKKSLRKDVRQVI